GACAPVPSLTQSQSSNDRPGVDRLRQSVLPCVDHLGHTGGGGAQRRQEAHARIGQAGVSRQPTSVPGGTPRVLIVGAGIAGITLAQLLRGRGLAPVLVDRSADAQRMIGDNRAGYMLALMPMVDPIIDALGAREGYLDASVGIERYIAHAHTGRVLRQDQLGELLAEYGDYRGISRSELLTVLTGAETPVAFAT